MSADAVIMRNVTNLNLESRKEEEWKK